MNVPMPLTPRRPLVLGRLMITPGAKQALIDAGIDPFDLLARHAVGDWGMVCAEDWTANDDAVRDGDRVLSAYPLPTDPPGQRIWIITEADRNYTTLLLPEEY